MLQASAMLCMYRTTTMAWLSYIKQVFSIKKIRVVGFLCYETFIGGDSFNKTRLSVKVVAIERGKWSDNASSNTPVPSSYTILAFSTVHIRQIKINSHVHFPGILYQETLRAEFWASHIVHTSLVLAY